MKTKLPLVFFLLFMAIGIYAQNSVNITSPPSVVETGEIITLNVAYTNATENGYVLIRFKGPSGENLSQDFEAVGNGAGSESLTIVAPTSSGPSYSLQAQLLASDWGGLAEDIVSEVTVGNETPPLDNDDFIAISSPPGTVEAGESITLDIDYTNTTGNGYVLVRFKGVSGENLNQDFKAIGIGSGTESLTIVAPSTTGNNYSLQAQLLAEDWAGLAEDIVSGIAVGNDSQPPSGDDSLSLTNTPNTVAQGERYEIGFNYDFSGERWVQAYLTNKTNDADGNWVKIAQGLQKFTQGSGNDAIAIQVTGEPLASNLLVVQVFEVVTTNGVDEWINVAEQTIDDIGFADSYGFGERTTTPNGNERYMRYYNRELLEGNGNTYNGNDVGNGSGVDHTLAPLSQVYRSNWWVNANWRGPIKSHYGEDNLNGTDFWVEWQNLGQGPGGHAEFDIRVEKSDKSDGGAEVGFPSRMSDITGPLNASFTGRWAAGSTGRCHINMTAWIHGVDPNGDEVRSDIIIHGWDNSGDIRSNYERSFEWRPETSNQIFYFDKIGTAFDGTTSYDVLRTIPGGFGEAASYNLIPTEWRRNHINEFPTAPFSVEMDVAEIIREVIRLEEENGNETRRLQNDATPIPVYTIKPDWELNVMEWTVTGQSGSYRHEPGNPDPDANVYVPNSRGRFTFEQYSIANPCSSNPSIACPSNNLNVQLNEIDAVLLHDTVNEAKVSPNPFTNSFSYEYGITKNEPVTIELYALNGRKIMTVKNNESHSAGNYRGIIETSDLDSGIYIIRIRTSEREEAIKLVKY